MAKANTFAMEKMGGYIPAKEGCAICGNIAEFRAFFYPTYMNGDAEWLGDYCKDHREINLKDVSHNKIKLLYKIGD